MRATIGGGHLLHDREGAIGGAVVGEDDFQRCIGLREGARHGLADVAFFVVGVEDEGNAWPRC